MSRLARIEPESAPEPLADLYRNVDAMFGGFVPNLMTTFGNSPTVLHAWMQLSASLSSTFTPQIRQQIAIAVAQAARCEYCLSANTAFGHAVGVSADDLEVARDGHASDPYADALVSLASAIVGLRGDIADAHLASARAAGVTDSDVVEVIGLVAMNTMMNYTNNVSQTEIDWPHVSIERTAA